MSVTAVLLQTWLVLPIFVPLALALLAFGHQFQLVRVRDNTCIVISDGDRDVHVPLRHVAEVSLSWAMNPSTVTIRLRDRTVLGRRIIFVPAFCGHPARETRASRDRGLVRAHGGVVARPNTMA
jgi:hypothetical protein